MGTLPLSSLGGSQAGPSTLQFGVLLPWATRDLMELIGWTSPQMLTRVRRQRPRRRSYDRIMDDTT